MIVELLVRALPMASQQLCQAGYGLDRILMMVVPVCPRPLCLEFAGALYHESMGENRNDGIAKAYASGGYSMRAIGKHFGLHYSRVSRIVSGAKNKT